MNLKIKPRFNLKRTGYHVLFWLTLSLFYDSVTSYMSQKPFTETIIRDILFYLPSDILGVYFTLYFLIPRFLLKKKYFGFTAAFLTFFIILIFAVTLPLQYLGLYIELTRTGNITPSYFEFAEQNVLIATTLKLMIIGIAGSIKLAKIWLSSQKKQQNLIKEKLEIKLQLKEAELKYLKAQINPHFLFNTLNNLYALILEKSPKAPETVLKISALLDYVLYESDVHKIELTKEINNIKSYIDLQKIRYDEKININVNIKGNPEKICIAPLLILPIIENAFKHGLDKSAGKGFVKIEINVSDDSRFNLKVTNSLNKPNNKTEKGIGLSNLKRRLDLQYPEKHKLEIHSSDNLFITELCINLC
ncbi:MAG: hypothetical protein GXO50_07770 [Chlorobi bacterium]|nr:hypothetical protein [Chlorobiota bacterium]